MVGIVILDYNNAADTIGCIESVARYTQQGTYKVVVVENGSNVETVDRMEDYVKNHYESVAVLRNAMDMPTVLPEMTLLISPTNDGYAEGNNKALRLYEHDDEIDTILILNNDILFTEDIIPTLAGYLKKLPTCGIVSPLLVKKDGVSIDYNCARHDYKKMQFFWEYLFLFKDLFGIIGKYEYDKQYLQNSPHLLSKEYFEIELPSGSCMMIDKQLFKVIGYFDNHTFLYFEENILYRKLCLVGRKNYITPQIRCVHLGASTSKKSSSMFTMGCQMKSTAYYLRQYRKAPILAMYIDVMSNLTRLKIWLKEKVG